VLFSIPGLFPDRIVVRDILEQGMMIEYYGRSEAGKIRDMNQDAILMHTKKEAGLFVVADGMGGHSHGEKASRLIIQILNKWWNDFDPSAYDYIFQRMILSVKQSVEEANAIIFEQYNQDNICGSTIALLFIYKNYYGILHAGDSRCYMYRKYDLKQMTVDDVWENQANISIAERMDLKHPNRGKLINAIGTCKEMKCKIKTDVWSSDTIFLLCSDGLYKMCTEKRVERCIRRYSRHGTLSDMCRDMLEKVYENGAEDNVSVVLVGQVE